MRSNQSYINVYDKKNTKSKITTQLLYGESFKIIKNEGSWIKIKNNTDSYRGFIKKKKFPTNQKNSHKVSKLFAKLYSGPNLNYKIRRKLSFGSKIKIIEKKNNFYKFDNYWLKKKDVKKIEHKNKNIFKNIQAFLNIKYKWGGKHFSGVDCSGLVQLFINYNNKYCPRDTKDQIKYFKKKVKMENIKKNDLIFWKGHVAIVISKNKLIHAYGPSKKTVSMNIKKTIDKIYKTANLKVIGVRRI